MVDRPTATPQAGSPSRIFRGGLLACLRMSVGAERCARPSGAELFHLRTSVGRTTVRSRAHRARPRGRLAGPRSASRKRPIFAGDCVLARVRRARDRSLPRAPGSAPGASRLPGRVGTSGRRRAWRRARVRRRSPSAGNLRRVGRSGGGDRPTCGELRRAALASCRRSPSVGNLRRVAPAAPGSARSRPAGGRRPRATYGELAGPAAGIGQLAESCAGRRSRPAGGRRPWATCGGSPGGAGLGAPGSCRRSPTAGNLRRVVPTAPSCAGRGVRGSCARGG